MLNERRKEWYDTRGRFRGVVKERLGLDESFGTQKAVKRQKEKNLLQDLVKLRNGILRLIYWLKKKTFKCLNLTSQKCKNRSTPKNTPFAGVINWCCSKILGNIIDFTPTIDELLPVSYTHLDVYKRQIGSSIAQGMIPFRVYLIHVL